MYLAFPTLEFVYKRQVHQIGVGLNHLLVLTTDKKLFGYGKNYWGQLGVDPNVY